MLSKTTIKLQKPDASINPSSNMASIFQGILMECLSSETCDWLHQQQRHPYSQYITYDNDYLYWTITTLTKEAYEKIIIPLSENSTSFFSKHHNVEFNVIEIQSTYKGTKNFINEKLLKDYNNIFTIKFITPTSFKSNNMYMNYPSVKWIFQSLMNKHDSNIEDNKTYDKDVLNLLEDNLYISQYNLRSTLYYIEGAKIPSFTGTIKLRSKCNQSINNLINYLLCYGEYSGIGIKSAMGMGAVKIESKERVNTSE